MSMLSAQCDELRAMAESVGLAMPQAATLMTDAADTIWELRCRLVDVEDRVRKSGELCKLCERESENAKLRELCGEMLDNLMPELCDKAWWCKSRDWRVCGDVSCGNYTFVLLVRELGVEVSQ